ncbi:MAG: SPOR domain-containing protein [Desulfobulbaceae bacterium]|nr:SPOR domain-containing protein [Desulfobulbaceae bacterium]HIJ79200.1 hypothetical protein [Deltaproteobacteria bacterium]
MLTRPISSDNRNKGEVRLGGGLSPQGANPYADVYAVQQADRLLQGTGQYASWRNLRQNNGGDAVKVADIINRRHALLEDARQGKKVDWNYFDQLTAGLKEYNIHLFKSVEIQSEQTGFASSSQPVFVDQTATPSLKNIANNFLPALTENNVLILNVTCGKSLLSESLIAYADEGQALLPLGEISAALGFAIKVDPQQGVATGWFISEDRPFALSVDQQRVKSGEKELPVTDQDLVVGDDDIYVTPQALAKWFPLQVEVSFLDLEAKITAKEKLPFQIRQDRHDFRNQHGAKGSFASRLPARPMDYDLFSIPVVDVNIQGGYQGKNVGGNLNSSYSVLAQGDIAYMQADLFASGDEKGLYDTTHIRLEKVDPEGKLLGPLAATQVAAGDIDAVGFPLLSPPMLERGVSVSNTPLQATRDFDTTFFQGTMQPGWEVELYRNDTFLRSQTVQEDGRYFFEDVPLFYGDNDFRIVGHGPQGEKREKIISRAVGRDMVPAGEGEYQVALSQRSTSVLPDKDGFTSDDYGSWRFAGTYQHGISSSLFGATGISSVQFENQRHNYLRFGLGGSLAGVYGQSDYVYDTSSGGQGVQFLGQSKVGPVNIRARQSFYENFKDENHASDRLASRSNISLNATTHELGYLPSFNLGLSLDHAVYDQHQTTSVSPRLSTRIGNLNLTNSINWRNIDSPTQSEDVIDGLFQASGQLNNDNRLSGKIAYDIKNDFKIRSYSLSHRWRFNDETSVEADISHMVEEEDATSVGLKLNWNAGPFTLSPRVAYSTEGEFVGAVSLSFSSYAEPRTNGVHMTSTRLGNNGGVSALAFHDKNNNRVFDGEDVPLPDISIRATQAGKRGNTDANGVVTLTGLPQYIRTDLELDPNSLSNPAWQPVGEGVSITPRPGHIDKVDFPVVTVGEVDGFIYRTEDANGPQGAVGVQLDLVDGQGQVVQRTRSEYDGFYLFEKVTPGDYTVRVSPDDGKYGMSAFSGGGVFTIGDEGTVVSDQDIVIDSTAKPTMLAAEKSSPVIAEGIEAPQVVAEPLIAALPAVFSKEPGKEETAVPSQAVGTMPLPSSPSGPAIVAEKVTAEKAQAGPHPEVSSPSLPILPERFTFEGRLGFSEPSPRVPLVSRPLKLQPVSPVVAGAVPYQTTDTFASSAIKQELGGVAAVAPLSVGTALRAYQAADSVKVPLVSRPLRPQAKAAGLVPPRSVKTAPAEVKTPAALSFHGVHLASFRQADKAVEYMANLRQKMATELKDSDFSIRYVDLGPAKGKWYRVMAGRFREKGQAQTLAKKLQAVTDYAKILPAGEALGTTLHLASYRTQQGALDGVHDLVEKFGNILQRNDIVIKKVDLGAEKGNWYRIYTGSFPDVSGAGSLREKLMRYDQYAAIIKKAE